MRKVHFRLKCRKILHDKMNDPNGLSPHTKKTFFSALINFSKESNLKYNTSIIKPVQDIKINITFFKKLFYKNRHITQPLSGNMITVCKRN